MRIFIFIFIMSFYLPLNSAEFKASVVALKKAEKRVAGSGKANVAILAKGKNAFFAKLTMDPGAKVPKHRDSTEEYIYILKGNGKISIEGKWYPVSVGDTIFMPANALVEFHNGKESLEAIQVFSGPEPAKKYNKWKAKK